MNRQGIATSWSQLNDKAKEKWHKPNDDGLLVKGKRAGKRPDPAVQTLDSPAPSDGAGAGGSRPDGVPTPPRTEGQRRALLDLRARLQGNVVRTAETVLSGDGTETTLDPSDTVDCASEVVEQDLAVSLLGSASKTLGQIETALQRMKEGKYGRCLECGCRIPAARLEAVPYATCCVRCAFSPEQNV